MTKESIKESATHVKILTQNPCKNVDELSLYDDLETWIEAWEHDKQYLRKLAEFLNKLI